MTRDPVHMGSVKVTAISAAKQSDTTKVRMTLGCGAPQTDKPDVGLSSCVVSIAAKADVTVRLRHLPWQRGPVSSVGHH